MRHEKRNDTLVKEFLSISHWISVFQFNFSPCNTKLLCCMTKEGQSKQQIMIEQTAPLVMSLFLIHLLRFCRSYPATACPFESLPFRGEIPGHLSFKMFHCLKIRKIIWNSWSNHEGARHCRKPLGRRKGFDIFITLGLTKTRAFHQNLAKIFLVL